MFFFNIENSTLYIHLIEETVCMKINYGRRVHVDIRYMLACYDITLGDIKTFYERKACRHGYLL